MPEYDAFGREIGENTLEGLGGDSRAGTPPSAAPDWEAQAEAARAAAASEPATRPVPAPDPEPEPEPPPAIGIGDPPPRPAPASPPTSAARRTAPRALGCLFSLFFLAAVVGVIGVAAAGFFGAAKDALDDVTDSIDAPAVTDLQAPDPPPEPPSGISGDSLIAPANLARVLGVLGSRSAAQLVVRPDRVAGELLQGGRGRLVQISADGSVFRSDPQPITGAMRRIDLRDVDVEAPTRLVRRSAARFKVRPEGIDYLVASPDATNPGTHHWVAYFKNGVYVLGDATGKVERRIQ